ncbi:hypothetical protein Pmani_006133 [Petrolisthes manimaculis]|uniref:Uncharacterized protein n=1 Tax=Petrolisthes manimaculis TaxID=1843537 RepID=A0AAE1QBL6_9EUCA|nr:hypothetical protein Pmani_006133 [Petrolisthes manimaculis]
MKRRSVVWNKKKRGRKKSMWCGKVRVLRKKKYVVWKSESSKEEEEGCDVEDEETFTHQESLLFLTTLNLRLDGLQEFSQTLLSYL